jgi:pyruvate dehydrogenase E2 component (dihydrolipoamide acetyltransferase)
MAIPITIPRLGWNMEEGTFLGWLKADGEPIRAGEMLFRLESEKAAEDIECLDAGILRIAPKGPQDGDTVPVGCVIGYLVQAGEELQIADFKLQIEKPIGPDPQPIPSPQSAISNLQSAISSPRARRVAAELGVDWTKLQGSGRDGRIRERDVRTATQARGTGKMVPLSSVRKAGVDRLVKSVQSTVPVTLTTTADVTELVKRRQQFKAAGDPVPSLTDMFVKATASALQQHPLLSGRWTDDGLLLPDAIHIGIAVDTDAGLLVPVVHDAATLSLPQIAERSRDLIERARAGKLTTRDLQGSVFTVTNLGMLGIDAFTPIINHPECAILGIGRVRRVPVFLNDAVVAREEITLSLTFDHRIVDGAPAARFLQTLVQQIELFSRNAEGVRGHDANPNGESPPCDAI